MITHVSTVVMTIIAAINQNWFISVQIQMCGGSEENNSKKTAPLKTLELQKQATGNIVILPDIVVGECIHDTGTGKGIHHHGRTIAGIGLC
jgi:hypothetical protein